MGEVGKNTPTSATRCDAAYALYRNAPQEHEHGHKRPLFTYSNDETGNYWADAPTTVIIPHHFWRPRQKLVRDDCLIPCRSFIFFQIKKTPFLETSATICVCNMSCALLGHPFSLHINYNYNYSLSWPDPTDINIPVLERQKLIIMTMAFFLFTSPSELCHESKIGYTFLPEPSLTRNPHSNCKGLSQ